MAFNSTLLAPPVVENRCDHLQSRSGRTWAHVWSGGHALVRWHPDCAVGHWTGAEQRAGCGGSICYLYCSFGHALSFPSCLPASMEMFVFNSQERETCTLRRARASRISAAVAAFKGNCSVSLPLSLQGAELGWGWLERLKHLADGPLGAGEKVCVCLTVQNKREKHVGAGIWGVSEDQCLLYLYEAEQEESY